MTADSLSVFTHLPKTGGTTFRRSYLTVAFARDERWILSGGEKNADDIEQFLRLGPKRRQRIRVVAGHNAEALRVHVPDARFLSVVRDPVDRLVSSYLHVLFHPDAEGTLWPGVRENRMGLRQFVETYEGPNVQSRELLGDGEFDAQTIGETLRTRYALVGYTEAFDQFVFLLHMRYGFPLCLYNKRLVRKERETYVPPADDVRLVREANEQDARLHQVVREEFQRQVEQLPARDRAMMERYLETLEGFRRSSGGDPARAVRLEEGHLPDDEAARAFEFVFGRRPDSVRA